MSANVNHAFVTADMAGVSPSIVENFSLTASPQSLTVDANVEAASNITVSPLNGFSGTVALAATTNSSSLSCTLTLTSISRASGNSTLSCDGSVAGAYLAIVNGTSGSESHSASVTFTVQDFSVAASPMMIVAIMNAAANSTITVSPMSGFANTVTLGVATNSTSLSCTLSPTSITAGSGSANLSCRGSSLGGYLATVTGTSGSLSHHVSVIFQAADFGITLPQSQVTIFVDSKGTVQFTFQSQSGFAGQIRLVPIVAPSEGYFGLLPVMTPSPGYVDLTAGGSETAEFIVSVGRNVTSGIFGIGVNATFGSGFVVSSVISLTVPPVDFSIAFNPAPLVTGPGVSGSSSITITSQGGLNGTVSFQPLAYSASGLTCTIGSSSVTLAVNGSATTALSCSGLVGSYNVTITGSGVYPNRDTFSEHALARVVVANFSLSSTPTGILLNTGQTGHARISISWANGYNGTVSLSLVPEAGLNASVSPMVLDGSSGTATVTVVADKADVYALVVNATSGSYSQRVSLTVTVVSNTPPPSDFGSLLAYSALALVVIVAAVIIVVRSRREKAKRRKRKSRQ
jgi:hypothetical protein